MLHQLMSLKQRSAELYNKCPCPTNAKHIYGIIYCDCNSFKLVVSQKLFKTSTY